MISIWLSYALIILIAFLFTAVMRQILKRISFLKIKKDLFIVFVISIAIMYLYLTLFCTHICIVTENEQTNHYVLFRSTTIDLGQGKTQVLIPESKKIFIVNKTNKALSYDLIIYSEKGNISAEYGHATIIPNSITDVKGPYPDYYFSNPPKKIWLWKNYIDKSDVTRSWLHTF